jgi:hypothetical protein
MWGARDTNPESTESLRAVQVGPVTFRAALFWSLWDGPGRHRCCTRCWAGVWRTLSKSALGRAHWCVDVRQLGFHLFDGRPRTCSDVGEPDRN